MIMNGPMGTMIQEHSLDENDFRGKSFVNHKTIEKIMTYST